MRQPYNSLFAPTADKIVEEVSAITGSEFTGLSPEVRFGSKFYSEDHAFRLNLNGTTDIFLEGDLRFNRILSQDPRAIADALFGRMNEIATPPVRVQRDVYAELEKEIKFFVKSKFNLKNLLVISGKPGTGKSELIYAIAEKHLGTPVQTKLPPIRGLLNSQVQKITKDRAQWEALPEDQKEGKEEPESVQARLNKVAAIIPPFRGILFKGSQDLTPYKLFLELYKTNGESILYDDSSTSFYRNEEVQEKLNHATNTNPKHRVITYASEGSALKLKDGSGLIPVRFNYVGKMIIITNRKIQDLPDYIQSRAIRVLFNPTTKEMINRVDDVAVGMKREFPDVEPEMIDSVVQWLKSFAATRSIKNYNHRLLTDLLYYKHQYEGDDAMFDRKAKEVIKNFYSGKSEVV